MYQAVFYVGFFAHELIIKKKKIALRGIINNLNDKRYQGY